MNEEEMKQALDAIHAEALKLMGRDDLTEEVAQKIALIGSIARYGFDVRSKDESQAKMTPEQLMANLAPSSLPGGLVPKGADGWWPTTNPLPEGYEFCDGTNGTPDLRHMNMRAAEGEQVVPIRRKAR